MATVAPGMSRPLLQENRLDAGFEELKIKSVCRGGMRGCLSGRRDPVTMADPFGKHFPFRVVLRCPELAARVQRIAARLLRQRMKQQMALQWFRGCDQLGDNLKVSARLLFRPRGTSRRQRLQPQARG